ncbi:insulinase family protein [Micromonospora schwarzwaldensis]|uniref:insulinase family protein n=1 Tax=Micromonospora sp. DSM 45708 TaxID=3111767 RepID=UPI0031D4EF25
MTGEVWRFSEGECQVIAVYRPGSPTTSLVATYGRGFGDDPAITPGVAHLHEHLFLATLRTVVHEPLVAHAQTHAESMRITVTVRAGAERQLVQALATTAHWLASSPVAEQMRQRECRAIDVELAEWFGSPLLVAGHKLAALAARRPKLGRFDECRPGDSARLTPEDLLRHAKCAELLWPRQIVVAGPSSAQEWQQLLEGLAARSTVSSLSATGGSRAGLTAQDGRVYAGIPLPATDAETAWLAARVMVHERGPLAEVGRIAGARFRGGSVIPTATGAVVAVSWLTDDARQREAIGFAMSQHDGCVGDGLIAAQAEALPPMRAAAATTSATLAAAVDGWQSGYGIDPTATEPPGNKPVSQTMHAGWKRAVLVGANLMRCEPF